MPKKKITELKKISRSLTYVSLCDVKYFIYCLFYCFYIPTYVNIKFSKKYIHIIAYIERGVIEKIKIQTVLIFFLYNIKLSELII